MTAPRASSIVTVGVMALLASTVVLPAIARAALPGIGSGSRDEAPPPSPWGSPDNPGVTASPQPRSAPATGTTPPRSASTSGQATHVAHVVACSIKTPPASFATMGMDMAKASWWEVSNTSSITFPLGSVVEITSGGSGTPYRLVVGLRGLKPGEVSSVSAPTVAKTGSCSATITAP